MSFKVGDVVEVLWVYYPRTNAHLVGSQLVIAEINPQVFDPIRGDYYQGYRSNEEPKTKYWQADQLRRIPPKDDPKSDFLPADDDFTRDLLKQLGRVSA